MQKLREGKIELFVPEGVFYNPEMELCRGISSLCVGAIGGKLSVVDAMCASGVRGLRYRKENGNVSSLTLCDLSRKAVASARKNANANRVKCAVQNRDACKILREAGGKFDFVELDPFGSPVPFLYEAARAFFEKKSGFLSVTATDMAVLCGAAHAACLKNYGATPLNSEFCHENAVRILIGKTTLTFAPFNLAAAPIYSLSHRHYVKIIFRLEKSADAAVESAKKIGFASYCPGCCWRQAGRLPMKEKCPECRHKLVHGGPLYIGKLWEGKLLEKMIALNASRDYAKRKYIEKFLRTQLAESKVDAYGYYDLHIMARKLHGKIMGMDEAIAALRKAGFAAERTHFCPTAIRSGAPHKEIVKLVRG